MTLYMTYVRPQLEYDGPTVLPSTLTEMGKIKGIQRYATGFVEGLHGIDHLGSSTYSTYATGDSAAI